jgi:FAD/FMN-containing dehydrogenase
MPLSRRQFLHGAGTAAAALGSAAVLGPLAAGCGNGRASSGPTTTRPTSTTSTTGAGPVDWSALAGSLAGSLVLPTDPSYVVDKQLYNERFDAMDPAAIAYCQSPTDVQRAIDFARRHGVQLAARSGGHSFGGYSSCPGLVVDVTRMATVTVAADGATATVGAGAHLIDVYTTLGQAGVLLPGGSCPTVGIAGLTLGGGMGVFGRNYGLTCDNLVAVDLVTADGRLLTCSQSDNEDLYWASRGGGGGNFGIATSFTFQVHPIPPVALFTLEWPWEAAADVLGAWLEWIATAPQEVWSNCQLLSSGDAGATGPTLRVTGVYCGQASALSGVLQPLQSAIGPSPTYDFVGPEPYLKAMMIEGGCEGSTVAQCHLPSQNPAGTLSRSAFAAKSAYLTALIPGAGAGVVVGAVEALDQQVPQVGGGFVFDSYGGVVNRIPAEATAFVHRNALAGIQYSFSWGTGATASVIDAGTSWLSGAQGDLAPYVDGAYQNYIDPTLADWQQAYYGSNLDRLVKVKRSADPDDVFHFAQSIPVHPSPLQPT